MSLIIGVRCKDGCLVLADYRNRIEENGKIIYEDNFEKVVKCKHYLLYNHGYNRINNEDWKLRFQDLTPDVSNPIYKDILDEMKLKSDKAAFYVFINKNILYEIVIEVENGVKGIDHLPHNRIVSGTGSKYINNLKQLENLQKRNCSKVCNSLKEIFKQAHSRARFLSSNEFSRQYKIYKL